ncbi:MAG: diguanylate cyclase [Firmicutes bacterium]|nr:diguanylate cyclase [Bacillota bacterium]
MSACSWDRNELLSTVVAQMHATVRVCDMQSNRILFANDQARQELGSEEGEKCCIDARAEMCSCLSNQLLEENPQKVIHSRWYNPRMDRWFERYIGAVSLPDGRLARLEIMRHAGDIQSDGLTPDLEDYARLIVESIGDAVIVTDSTGVITMMNPQAERLTGWLDARGMGKQLSDVFQVINTQTRKPVQSPVGQVLSTGKIVGLANHTTLLSRNGEEYHISDSAAPVKDSEGNIHGVVLVFRDVSEDYRQREKLRKSEERFRTLMETSINAIALHELITDSENRPIDYRFLEVNRAFEELTGLSAQELVGKTVLEVLPGTEKTWIETYGQIAQSGIPQQVEDFSQELGKHFIVRAYSPRRGQFVTVFDDITERKEMELRLREQVYRDPLTGLHNRRYLEGKLPDVNSEDQLPLSVIIGDVNGLKIINDSMGHQKGDEILKDAADVFRAVARPEDVVVRWGGDEFLIVLPKTSSLEAQTISTEITERSATTSEFGLTPSIALGYSTKTEPEDDLADVFRRAETSMYQQKMSSAQSRRSALVLSLQQALAEKSHETEEHARNLQRLAVGLAQRMELSDGEVVTSSLVALLHDIGKVAISESILDKSGPLTAEEWDVMKRHCEIGYRIVASSPDLLDVAEGVLYHHERWDGGGYPHGLVGEDIPIAARIVALADAFDAMTSDRPYRKALSRKDALAEIALKAGCQFDPALTGEFLNMLKEPSSSN